MDKHIGLRPELQQQKELSNGFSDTGNKLVDTSEAVSAALTMFETDHGEMTNLFKGLKASPEQNGVVVKVYLTDGSNMSYSCHRHTEKR